MQSTFTSKWWHQPHDYEATVRDLDKFGALRPYRIAAAFTTFTYGLIPLTLLLTRTPPTSVAARAIIVAAGLSAFVLSIAWLKCPWPSERMAMAFGVLADVGVASVLLAYGSPPSVFLACALFATNGIFIQLFLSPRMLSLHLVWSGAVVISMFVLVLGTPGADRALAVVQVLVLLPVTFMGPTFLQYLLLRLQVQAAGANVDPLTALRNRRGLDEELSSYLAGAVQVAAMVIDVDRFKAINDRFGHHVGDSALELTARRLSVDGVLVARTGGEEFAVVARLGGDDAVALAEQLRTRVHSADDRAPLTVSIGVVHGRCDFTGWGPDDVIVEVGRLLRGADVAMYDAKRRGGDQVVVADGHHSRSNSMP
ncbi:GGDEF domain-containing protein [Rhodococcus sp. NPDC078407]|uniref:GGDEF domain-containing protein n=1 Tax=Rhodococcus sp. NPDC078407 TaxID=3364509 RepID=UPI0037CC3F4A